MKLLIFFMILTFIIEILLPDKKKRKRNYRRKSKKTTENQKIIILSIIVSIILLINFPKTILLFIIILIIAGIYLFLKNNNILKIFEINNNGELFNKSIIDEMQKLKYNKKQKIYKKTVKKRVGDNYEREVGKYYESFGYKIIYNGLEKGYLDEGIDIIATNKDKTLLIQCKNWKNKTVTITEIYKFLENCNKFISKRNFKTRKIKKIFAVSNKERNLEIEEFMQRNENLFEYTEIPYLNIYK